ncbi:hypothetical protein HMSSN139_55040 [Paenibacillus sp. HMSSN-139]|nr:hypothetical protein HMSSN139_55040 [Paenibacillus sp. HMSSN-139]
MTLLLAAATDFAGYDKTPGSGGIDPAERCRAVLAAAAEIGYERLRERHVADHRLLFGRVELRLGSASAAAERAALPTNERLDAYRSGTEDLALEALYFHYGRYLLMASSGRGRRPPICRASGIRTCSRRGTAGIRPTSIRK